ncbi:MULTISPECIES: glycosyltransferase family 39 protein [unclassified Marichromatium]|uniref:ArnT family glycosyltransferase n=1 Tax=unclassified Marichromatium TaxID=2618417 RepID=UPI000F3BEACF|nr:glycosyltransferase family 39 protein [Marichromatium sp. AB32]MBO8087361.1 glycosyltransferase family 39 protein [Marichromatium sp.]RNE94233.1 glycosyltransferase family 39 protein [Marichromatium sp. AB32]
MSRPETSPLTRALTSPWLLAAVVLFAFYWQLGAVPLYDLDEGAFTEATREMLASGNFITPHKDGEPRYDKPVLIYWLQALSASSLGFDEFSLRLPSALAATLWVMALWGFVRARLDAPTATVAALVMTLSLQVSLIAKAAVADAVLNLFIALAFFEIYRYFLDPGERRSRNALLRAYLWMGLGFLTKGPVAVFFPVVVSFLFFWSQGRLERWLRAAFAPLGWLVFVLVAGPWYLAVYLDDGAGFFRSFFLEHNAGRFGGTMHGHSGFPGYYLVVLPLILLPFTGWFLSLLPRLRASWADPLDRFLWLWFATVFLFFSFSGTKLPHYLLYGAAPLFILMARHRDALTSRALAMVPPLVFLALLLALPLVVQVAAGQGGRAHEIAQFELALPLLGPAYLAQIALATALVVALALWSRPALWQRLVLVGLIQTAVVYGTVVPRVFAVMQAPVKEAGLLARELDRPTVVYRTSMPSFSVYRDAITPHRPPRAGDLVFLRLDKLDRLAEDYPLLRGEQLYRRGPVALVLMHPREQARVPGGEG